MGGGGSAFAAVVSVLRSPPPGTSRGAPFGEREEAVSARGAPWCPRLLTDAGSAPGARGARAARGSAFSQNVTFALPSSLSSSLIAAAATAYWASRSPAVRRATPRLPVAAGFGQKDKSARLGRQESCFFFFHFVLCCYFAISFPFKNLFGSSRTYQ